MGQGLYKIRHYFSVLGLPGVMAFLFAKITGYHPLMGKKLAGIEHPIYIRIGTTDLFVLKQVFVEQHYDSPLPKTPNTIVDAASNIGLSAVYFANRYPGVTVVAIEPEDSKNPWLCSQAA